LPVKRTPQGKARAKAVIDFIERLTVPSGTGQGKPFKLDAFQKLFIRDIYEPHIGANRAVRRAILSIARKNGKTALIAAIVLAHLVGPETLFNARDTRHREFITVLTASRSILVVQVAGPV